MVRSVADSVLSSAASPIALRRWNFSYRLVQGLAVALALILAAGILKVGCAPYIAFAFCGSFLIMASGKCSGRDILWSAVLGLGFFGVYRLHHGPTLPYFGQEIATPGAFLGMGAVQLLANRWIGAPALERQSALVNLARCGLVPLLCIGSMIAVSLAAQLTPITYDPVIYAFDLRFASDAPSWRVGALFGQHDWLRSLCGYVYNSLPLVLSACLALQWRERSERFVVNCGLVFLTLGVIGFALYQICPASGPAYLFPRDFPAHQPAPMQVITARLAISPRNGMPSLHVGWTFLLLWNLRRRPLLGPLAAVFLVLTVLATLGSGEHYLADLMVAIPLALTVQSVFLDTPSAWRWTALAAGSIIALAWLTAFRTGLALSLPGGAVLWALAAITVLVPPFLTWRAERAG